MDQDHRLQDWSVPHATPNIELRLDQFKFLWTCNFEVNGAPPRADELIKACFGS